jgi:gliding motility-associated-like protein
MEISRYVKIFLLTQLLVFVFSLSLYSQSLTSGSADFSEQTSYPVFTPNDPVYYFHGNDGDQKGSLTAQSGGQTVTFTWEKYNPLTGTFNFLLTEVADKSTQSNLSDGCYRVSFTENGNAFQFRAWIFNSWINPAAAVTESDCSKFRLQSSATGSNYTYYDLSSGQPVVLNSGYRYIWYVGTTLFSTIQSPYINDPPSVNTKYKVEITDRAGCMKSAEVTYLSIVPKAQFSWTTPQKVDAQYSNPEAPAEIDFMNESENADKDKYEWYLFKDKAVIEDEASSGTLKDSIMNILYDENPVYIYENSGKYKVKLVAAKENPEATCRDTFYLEDYIVVDTSFIAVPNVFTPNGDGTNDEFVVKFWSMQSLEIDIFNRWGKRIHHWQSGDVQGFEGTWSETVWDGRGMGGRYASPGVYYYAIKGEGRDGVTRRKEGFFHLFRGKD